MGKEVSQEIERKYLLTAIPDINYDAIIRISQFYKEDKPERIRRSELFPKPRKPIENFWMKDDHKIRCEHTIKKQIEGKEGLQETNKEISIGDFDNMSKNFPNQVFKLRHVKSCKNNPGLKWEIDDFSCHSTRRVKIIMAEIEVPELSYEVTFPLWLKPYVLMEVTEDKRFSNFALAKRKMYR